MLEAKVEELEDKLSGLESKFYEEINPKLRKNPDAALRQGTRIPTSCLDLRANGHISSGLYIVMGIHLIETVFFDFSKQSFDSSR